MTFRARHWSHCPQRLGQSSVFQLLGHPISCLNSLSDGISPGDPVSAFDQAFRGIPSAGFVGLNKMAKTEVNIAPGHHSEGLPFVRVLGRIGPYMPSGLGFTRTNSSITPTNGSHQDGIPRVSSQFRGTNPILLVRPASLEGRDTNRPQSTTSTKLVSCGATCCRVETV
jgi:hypothetical protein